MSRLTRAMVESRVKQLNAVLGNPATPSHYDSNNNYVQHPNHIYLEQLSDSRYYRLAVMCQHGAADFSSGGTLQEINQFISGMLTMHYGVKDYSKV